MDIDAGQLIDLLPNRRWFGGKGRKIDSVGIYDHAVLDDGPPALVVAIADVSYAGGGSDLYHVMLLIDEDGTVREALDDVERLRLLGDLMAGGVTIKGQQGTFHYGGPGLDPMSPPGHDGVWAVQAEQSNSSLVLDDKVILKLFRRVEVGGNPDLELNRLLTNEGFPNIPAQVGEVIYESGGAELPDAEPEVLIDLGIAQEFLHDATEGWDETLRQLHRLYDSARDDDPDAVEESADDILGKMERLGDVTGSLHVLLSREGLDPDIAPEPVEERDLHAWADGATESLERLLDEDIAELREVEEAIRARIDALRGLKDPGQKTRIHGDYHLGQAMRTTRGWVILDFEGEPLRPLAERRAKQSPLRDVAGMLRSFSYVATAALFERTELDSDEWKRLQPWAERWEQLAWDRFLTGYLGRSREGKFLPGDNDEVTVMLDAFEIDKAMYEVSYERSHRPEWLRIPLRGIEQVIERGERR